MVDLFNIPTLALCFCATAVTIGIFVVGLWLRDRGRQDLLFWSIGFAFGASGMLLTALRVELPGWLALGVANVLVSAGCGAFWLGFRAFDRQPLPFGWALAGAVAWSAFYWGVPGFAEDINGRIIVMSVVIVFYSLLAAASVWDHRGAEPLPSRRLVSILLATHAVAYFARIPMAILLPTTVVNGVPKSIWYGIFTFEMLLHALACGFAIFTLVRERIERGFRVASETDALTGVLNRRAFLDRAEAGLRSRSGGVLMVLDLDHFKRINDSFGHAAGDRVLVQFAELVTRQLGRGMVFGRIGGEEFALFAPSSALADGMAFAEEIRATFAGAALADNGDAIAASVSIGVCSLEGKGCDLGALMAQADRALYVAKAEGRNRVSLADCSAKLRVLSPATGSNTAGPQPWGQVLSA